MSAYGSAVTRTVPLKRLEVRMTGQILHFPNKELQQLTGDRELDSRVAPSLGVFDRVDIMEAVFEVNFDFLGIRTDVWAVDLVEFFCLPKDPNTVFVDIDALPHDDLARGLYKVDLSTYELIKLSDKPLRHFL